MKRLIEKIVFCGLVTVWRLARVPTSRSPELVNATTDGVVRPPSAFSITVGSPPSSTAMHEFVVPRSMPMVLAIFVCSFKRHLQIFVRLWQISYCESRGLPRPREGRLALRRVECDQLREHS